MKQTPYNGWPYPDSPQDEATIPSHVEGFILPIDAAIAQLHAIAGLPGGEFTSQLDAVKWAASPISSGSLASISKPGSYPVTALAVEDKPVNRLGVVSVQGANNGVQLYLTWENPPRIFIRQKTATGWGAWSSIGWKHPDVASGTNFDDLVSHGVYGVVTSSTTGGPAGAGIGVLEVFTLGHGAIHRYTTWEDKPRTWERRGNLSTKVWSPWNPVVKEAAPVASETPKETASASGTKVVPMAITCPGTPLAMATTAGAVRWARSFAHAPKRVRIHVKNANAGNALSGDALTLDSIRVGGGSQSGDVSASVIAHAGGVQIPGNSGEIVTGWVGVPGIEDGGSLVITVSWRGGDGVTKLQKNQGGGWVTADPALASAASTAGWEYSKETPLHVWVEAEVPACAPVILGHGDSITVGTASSMPVEDSWVAQLARKIGAVPVILAMHGSKMTNWGAGAVRWKLYGDFDLSSVVDVVVTTLGQNDLAEAGMTAGTLKSRHESMMAALRGIFPHQPVFYGAITPSNKPAAVEVVRREFNAYRRGLPLSARGYIDFAIAVGGSADEDLLKEYSADGLHPNTLGQAVMAEVVERVRIAPRCLTYSQMERLMQ